MAIFNSYVNVYQRVMAGWLTFHGTSENIPPKNDQTLDDLGTHRLATQIGHLPKKGWTDPPGFFLGFPVRSPKKDGEKKCFDPRHPRHPIEEGCDGRQAADAVDGLLDHLLRVVVQGTGGLIQEEEGGLRTCGFPKGVKKGEKCWENDGKMLGKWWENDGKAQRFLENQIRYTVISICPYWSGPKLDIHGGTTARLSNKNECMAEMLCGWLNMGQTATRVREIRHGRWFSLGKILDFP